MYIHIYFWFLCFQFRPGPRGPQNRPEMDGTGGPGPPKNNPTVEQ